MQQAKVSRVWLQWRARLALEQLPAAVPVPAEWRAAVGRKAADRRVVGHKVVGHKVVGRRVVAGIAEVDLPLSGNREGPPRRQGASRG